MPKKVLREPRELGCPVSEFVRKSAREPSRNPSRALFGQSDKFGSARLSVGQTKKFWPRLGRRSDNPRIFVRMSTPGLTSIFSMTIQLSNYIHDPTKRKKKFTFLSQKGSSVLISFARMEFFITLRSHATFW